VIILLSIFAVTLLVDLVLILLWIFNFKKNHHVRNDQPFVSVLVAARDEEKNLARCLDSLIAVNYPEDKIEILIGDDQSEDKTWEIANAYSIRYQQVHAFKVRNHTFLGNGKANVLTFLAHQTKGEYMFMTDADIMVPEGWIQSMLNAMSPEVSLVTGTSVVTGKGLLAYMQQLDWLFAGGMLKVVSDLGIAVTTMGNNLVIRKSTYEAVGGFEALPFSITEDLELFNQVKKKYHTVNLFDINVLNRSRPLFSFGELLEQRKRWMHGAFNLPWVMVTILLIQALFFPLLITTAFINPMLALAIFGVKFILRYLFAVSVAFRLNEPINLLGCLVFEIYIAFFSFISLLYYSFSGPITWKRREY